MTEASGSATTCRSCGSSALRRFLSLGETPLADALVKPEDAAGREARYPLDVAFCEECTLVQILETVPPEELYCRDYPYYSSFSDAWLQHCKEYAEDLMARRDLGPDSLVVELASNDGYLLKNFHARGIPVLGIDPAEGPVKAAREIGIDTLCDFFGADLAGRLRAEGRRADVTIANNVLAHVADLNGFVAGVATLLKDTGVGVFEFPYVRDLIEHGEFDTIYHEHLCYFSVTALQALFRRHDLHLNRVEHHDVHGGSLRIFVEPVLRPEESVGRFLAAEREAGLTRAAYYDDFGARVQGILAELRDLLTRLKEAGHSIAAYGAAAKGSTLLNCAGIGTDLLDFVVDRNVHKQGRLMPGVHVPIRAPEELLRARPDHVLILAWNFQDEIIRQQSAYAEAGGRFIVPIPRPRVL